MAEYIKPGPGEVPGNSGGASRARKLTGKPGFSLDAKYLQEDGIIVLSGTQALVRLPHDQHRADKARGLNTATFISGYRGSPLGGLDMLLHEQEELIKRHHVRFVPGINEDLGATAVFGSQLANLLPNPIYDGVLGVWYGKSPGVDEHRFSSASPHLLMLRLAFLLPLPLLAQTLAGCSKRMGKDGRTETDYGVKYLAKTEVGRMADTTRKETAEGLLLIADKLYKRNPKEWKKGGALSREAAVDKLRQRQTRNWPEFNGLREGQAASLAFTESYTGDRVAALIFGLLNMVDAAYEHKEEFFILASLDEMRLYNSARNMEIAVWKLGNDKTAKGELFLLANELDPNNRNLSFEREFGRVMGLLDLMAKIVADRNGRGLSRLTQGVVSTIFLPVRFF